METVVINNNNTIVKPVSSKKEKASKLFVWVLGFILMIRIVSFFTLYPDSVAVTRVAKIGLRILMTGSTVFLLLRFLNQKNKQQLEIIRILPIGFYSLYLFMGICSIFWTTNVTYTILQLTMTIENFIFAILFYSLLVQYETKYKVDYPLINILISRSILIIALVFLMGYFFFPDTFIRKTHGGTVSRMGGFLLNPNEMGMLMGVGMAMVGNEWLNKKINFFSFLAAVIPLVDLLLTQSRSSLVAFILVCAFYVMKSKSIALKIFSVAGGIAVMPIIVMKVFIKDGNVDEVLSMTDRLPFWKGLLSQNFPDSPLIGRGFMSISNNTFTNKFESIYAYAASMTHNTFIQVLINLGLIGATIVLLQLVYTFYAAASSKNKNLSAMTWAMLIPLMINSFTEFGIFGETNHGILFYQFIILFFTVEVVRTKSSLS